MVKLQVSVKVESPCTLKDTDTFDTTDTSVSNNFYQYFSGMSVYRSDTLYHVWDKRLETHFCVFFKKILFKIDTQVEEQRTFTSFINNKKAFQFKCNNTTERRRDKSRNIYLCPYPYLRTYRVQIVGNVYGGCDNNSVLERRDMYRLELTLCLYMSEIH